jgi:hypothetical protein
MAFDWHILKKTLGFQNTVLMVHFVINHMLSKHKKQNFRENIYMIIYICE